MGGEIGTTKVNNQAPISIPEEIIFWEILPRLPVKSLIRFKSVCKKWATFISTSKFKRTHLHLTSPGPPDHFIILNCGGNNECCSLSHNFERMIVLETDLAHILEFPDIIGSCNGLVCLHSFKPWGDPDDGYLFALWNPATREFRRVGFPCKRFSPFIYGFGYEPVLDDYFIIAGQLFPGGGEDIYVGVFFARSDEWKRVTGFDIETLVGVDNSVGVFAEGSLYWYMEGTGEVSDIRILEFDLASEQFRCVSVLDSGKGYKWVELHVIEGCLALCCGDDNAVADVVMLRRQSEGNACHFSWEKVYSFPFRGGYSYTPVKWYTSAFGKWDSSANMRFCSPPPSRALSLGFVTTNKRLIRLYGQLKLVDSTETDLEHPLGFNIPGFVRSVQQHVYTMISPFVIAPSPLTEEDTNLEI